MVSTISPCSDVGNMFNILMKPSQHIIWILSYLCIDAILSANYFTTLGTSWENNFMIVAFYWLVMWRDFALSWIWKRMGDVKRFFFSNGVVSLHSVWAHCIIFLKGSCFHYFSTSFEWNERIINLLEVNHWKVLALR